MKCKKIMLAKTVEAIGGAGAAYVGYRMGAYLATLMRSSGGIVEYGFSWLGMYIGREIGIAAAHDLLDWFLDGQVSENDKLRRCRKALGNLKFNATVEEIKAAHRKASKKINLDKSVSEKVRAEVNMCVAMLQEQTDKEAQAFILQFFQGLKKQNWHEIFQDMLQ
mmetsp:Transcript_7627/g.9410  ORF Transcript_7627/g.9410 Transcript_7627/m.9410 type:complete len:165 (-) Transcript_7627:143-637(-)